MNAVAKSGGPTDRGDYWSKIFRVAWMAILLGIVLQVLLLGLSVGAGAFEGLDRLVADLVRNTTWAMVVCAGLALGTAVSNFRPPAAGLAGLLAAPIAFNSARVVQKGAEEALDVTSATPSFNFLLVITLLKALEYGFLGFVLGWVGTRPWGGLWAHAGTGLIAGVVFGGAIIAYTAASAATPLPTTELVSRGVNEFVFPIGCSLVIFAADAFGRHAPDFLTAGDG